MIADGPEVSLRLTRDQPRLRPKRAAVPSGTADSSATMSFSKDIQTDKFTHSIQSRLSVHAHTHSHAQTAMEAEANAPSAAPVFEFQIPVINRTHRRPPNYPLGYTISFERNAIAQAHAHT